MVTLHMATKKTATKQVAVNDIGSAEDFLAAVEATLKFFNDGDLISGTIVKIDRDEVLLDVGYKTEGVIPVRELSIRQDADPNDIVNVGDAIEALVLQKEDKEGRLILSKKRETMAQQSQENWLMRTSSKASMPSIETCSEPTL